MLCVVGKGILARHKQDRENYSHINKQGRGREKWSFVHVRYEVGWKPGFPPAFQLQQEYNNSRGR